MVKKAINRWKSKYLDKRNWKTYHEELILQGEFFFDLNFLENWDDELSNMNRAKNGAPYRYPESLFNWLSPIYSFLSSRKIEGALNQLSKFIPRLNRVIIVQLLNA